MTIRSELIDELLAGALSTGPYTTPGDIIHSGRGDIGLGHCGATAC